MAKQFIFLLVAGIFSTTIFSQDSTNISNTDTTKTVIKPINVSFVYPFCLYGQQAKENNYYISFNILGGKVRNVSVLEIGGLYNISHDVQFLQIGGLFNHANNLSGLQIGGLWNFDKGNTTAIQIGGLANIIKNEFLGIQVGGVGNMNYGNTVGIQVGGVGNIIMDEFTGIQVGGLFNYGKKQTIGMQVGGLFNYAKSDAMGMQVGGIFNTAMGIGAGLQVAGIFNLMNNYSGLEIAGITNISLQGTFGFALSGITNITKEDFKGIEVSLVNYVGKSSNGIQIGLVNYADTIGKGFALGLINIIKKGRYSEVELSTSNTVPIAVSYKSGTKKFYNIYSVGYYFSNNPFIHFGLGLGGKYSFNKYIAMQPELVSYTYFLPNDFSSYSGYTMNFNLGITYDINKRFAILLAPTLYVNLDDKKENLDFFPNSSLTKGFYNKVSNNIRTLVGIGYKVGLAVKL